MNQKTLIIVAVTMVVTLALASKLRSLPVLSAIPTV
jgi:hypothetical protein